MASGPIHPSEQVKKRSRSIPVLDGKVSRAAITEPQEEAKQAPVAHDRGRIGPNERGAVSITADLADLPHPPATARSRAKNGAGSQHEPDARRLRFTLSLQAKLAKGTDFSISVLSPETNRGPVIIESIRVSVHRKGESLFG